MKKDDAITAYKKYNNRCLDGKSGRERPPHLPAARCSLSGSSLQSEPASGVAGRTLARSALWTEGFLGTKNTQGPGFARNPRTSV